MVISREAADQWQKLSVAKVVKALLEITIAEGCLCDLHNTGLYERSKSRLDI